MSFTSAQGPATKSLDLWGHLFSRDSTKSQYTCSLFASLPGLSLPCWAVCVLLSPVFLSPHSISFAGNRCWDLLISTPSSSHWESRCLSHLCCVQRKKGFFRSAMEDQLLCLFDSNCQNLNLRDAADIQALPQPQNQGEFQGFVARSRFRTPRWGTSRTSSPLNDRTVQK